MVTLASSSINISLTVGANLLTNFVDNLDQDPPEVRFDATLAGTVTWDFHSSATPPSKGAGDIATGTDSVIAGANSLPLDLSAYPLETGYIHFRVTSGELESNVLTSQEITVPAFSPTGLFKLGDKGAFYDFTSGNLFTDTSRTTAAVVDDAVASFTDLSGNGNHGAQATSSRRPAMKNDAAGDHLLFAGPSDDVFSIEPIDLSGSNFLTIFAVYQPTVSENEQTVVAVREQATGGHPSAALRSVPSGSQVVTAGRMPSASAEVTVGASLAGLNRRVVLSEINAFSPYISVKANGSTKITSTASWTGTPTQWLAASRFAINGSNETGGNGTTQNIYAVFVINRELTSTEQDSLIEWGRQRAGNPW